MFFSRIGLGAEELLSFKVQNPTFLNIFEAIFDFGHPRNATVWVQCSLMVFIRLHNERSYLENITSKISCIFGFHEGSPFKKLSRSYREMAIIAKIL